VRVVDVEFMQRVGGIESQAASFCFGGFVRAAHWRGQGEKMRYPFSVMFLRQYRTFSQKLVHV